MCRKGPCEAPPSTLRERVDRALAELKSQEPGLRIALEKLARRYQAMKPHGRGIARRRALAVEIRNLDSRLAMNRRCAAVVTAVAFYGWRLQLDSPTVAAELGIHAPHVRQLLMRLRIQGKKLGFS
jgi:hypothetical protein